MQLAREDFQRIDRFFCRVTQSKFHANDPLDGLRERVLQAMTEEMGYRHVTFWLADSANNLTDPRFYNVEPYIMEIYSKQYRGYDPFDYHNLRGHFKHSGVLMLNDITSRENYFANNVYQRQVLDQFAYHDKMVLVLYDGNRFLGGMSFLSAMKEHDFTYYDRMVLDKLTNYISFLLLQQMKISQLEQSAYKPLLDLCPDCLTPREREVMSLILLGLDNREISERLYISLSTVKSHIWSIYKKLGVEKRSQLIVRMKQTHINAEN